jgi:uncharacterized YigZ family protein
MSDEFRTIEREVRAETKVRGSRFITTAAPAADRGEAEALVARVRAEFHDATHHCFGYRLGTDDNEFRYSDAGEPSGSAGKPILLSIDKRGLTNVCVVVARYFGGTKLGIGGLVRAYGNAADQVLAAVFTRTRFKTTLIEASFPHAQISNVMHVISKAGARLVDTSYDEDVHLQLEIRQSKAREFASLLINQTSGNIRLNSNARDGDTPP